MMELCLIPSFVHPHLIELEKLTSDEKTRMRVQYIRTGFD